MRWYDLEPDVCMAISMIECAPPNAQVQYAEYIIKLVQEKDKELEYIKNITKTNLSNRHSRWYDKNETKNIQKEVSLSVLALINSAVA